MPIEFETHEAFNFSICATFAGLLLTNRDPVVRSAASSNYRRLYKLLTSAEKKELHSCLKMLKEDPKQGFQQMIDFLSDAADDNDIIDRIKEDPD